ncbi:iron-siderophore ABC transporter substrate-binding protein [Stackebrandtia albiflava]
MCDVANRANRIIAAAVGVTLLAGVAACGGSSGEESSGADGFSASVDGAYGAVEVHARPERVVALSLQVAEILVELGIQPVAIASSQDEINEFYPWLDGVFTGDLDPELTPNYVADPEAIGSYEPDLVVGNTWTVAEDVYAQLDGFVPTFPGLAEANDDWDAVAVALGELTGTDGQGLVDSVAAECAAAQERLPDLVGGTYQYVAAEEGQYRFGNGSWLECFGLVPADNQDNTQSTDAAVSEELLDQLDADVLAVFDRIGARADIEADPRFEELPSATSGAVLWLDAPVANATNSPGPLSHDYFIAELLPELESAAAEQG